MHMKVRGMPFLKRSKQPDGAALAPGAAADSEPAAPVPEVARPLGDLAGRLGRVEDQLAGFHRRAAHREAVIDRLHEENQRLREGIGRAFLEPVITDLIRLHDQLSREVRRLEASGEDPRLFWSFAEDVAQILDRCGVAAFSAEPGEKFERGRHRALAVVACDDETRHNTVAEVVAVGFANRDTGRIRRPVHARVFQYATGSGTAGQAPSTARSL
jgi:molecular chaperone GrpE (heat shock protein)